MKNRRQGEANKGSVGTRLKRKITELYEGSTPKAHRFRYGLLAFDIFMICFLVATSFTSHSPAVEIIDAIVGAVLLAEFAARLWISSDRAKFLFGPFGIADLVVIISLLAPIVGEGFAFLRVARMLRLLRSYQLVKRMRKDFGFFRRNEQTVLSATNLGVFLFVMTAIVYETQHHRSASISNYVDALYFTVTALTTTGFGDVVLQGTPGRLISVVIMICGVSLFLRLVQVMLRPAKVDFRCPDCGLRRHDYDAVHCKACGRLLNIEDEGLHG
jgi:voltage-gated potassium channel